jgi:hypothetical protein
MKGTKVDILERIRANFSDAELEEIIVDNIERDSIFSSVCSEEVHKGLIVYPLIWDFADSMIDIVADITNDSYLELSDLAS